VIYEGSNEPTEAGMGEVVILKNELLLILADDKADNIITLRDLIKEVFKVREEVDSGLREVSEP
jgi:cellobiose-specific phosphotransferase system component IIA